MFEQERLVEKVIDCQSITENCNAKIDKVKSRQCSFLNARAILICLELHQPTRTEHVCAIYQDTPWSSLRYTRLVSWISFDNNILERKAFIACAFGLTAFPYRQVYQYLRHAFEYMYTPSLPACRVRRRRSQNVAQRVSTPRTEAIKPKTRVPMSSGPH